MINLLKEGNTFNTNIQQYLLDSIEDIPSIPWSAPVGSTAIILNETEFLTKMKKRQNVWADIDSGVEIPVEPPKPIEPEVPDYGPVVATFDLSESQDKSVVMNVYQPEGQKQQLVVSGKGKIINPNQEFQTSEYNMSNPDDFENSGIPSDLIIEDGITEIGDTSFLDCTGIKSVSIPSSVNKIGFGAFGNCLSLKLINIPEGVTSIGEQAFVYNALESVHIPASITLIGASAFGGQGAYTKQSTLSSITVDKANPVYDSRNNCNALIETATNNLILGCDFTTIPSEVKKLSRAAFYGCTFESIKIPDSVTEIGDIAFNHCLALKSIVIPASVTKIGVQAFAFCSALKSVVILDGVTEIGDAAFSHCLALKSIVIPDSVTKIGVRAFTDTGLTSVEVPKECSCESSFPIDCTVTRR